MFKHIVLVYLITFAKSAPLENEDSSALSSDSGEISEIASNLGDQLTSLTEQEDLFSSDNTDKSSTEILSNIKDQLDVLINALILQNDSLNAEKTESTEVIEIPGLDVLISITNGISDLINAPAEQASQILTNIKEQLDSLPSIFNFEGSTSELLNYLVLNGLASLTKGITNIVEAPIDFVSNTVSNVQNQIESILNADLDPVNVVELASNGISHLTEGISDIIEVPSKIVSNIVSNVQNQIESVTNVDLDPVNVVELASNGISDLTDGISDIIEAPSKLVSNIESNIQNVEESLPELSLNYETNPDLSEIETIPDLVSTDFFSKSVSNSQNDLNNQISLSLETIASPVNELVGLEDSGILSEIIANIQTQLNVLPNVLTLKLQADNGFTESLLVDPMEIVSKVVTNIQNQISFLPNLFNNEAAKTSKIGGTDTSALSQLKTNLEEITGVVNTPADVLNQIVAQESSISESLIEDESLILSGLDSITKGLLKLGNIPANIVSQIISNIQTQLNTLPNVSIEIDTTSAESESINSADDVSEVSERQEQVSSLNTPLNLVTSGLNSVREGVQQGLVNAQTQLAEIPNTLQKIVTGKANPKLQEGMNDIAQGILMPIVAPFGGFFKGLGGVHKLFQGAFGL